MRAINLLRVSSIQLLTLVYELFYFLKLTSFRCISHSGNYLYDIIFRTTFAVYVLAIFVLTYCKQIFSIISYLIPWCFEKGQLSLQTKCFFYLSFNNIKEKLFTTCSENNSNWNEICWQLVAVFQTRSAFFCSLPIKSWANWKKAIEV